MTGVAAGDIVIFNDDTQEDGLFAEAAEQTTANQLLIRFCNFSGVTIDGGVRSHNFVILR